MIYYLEIEETLSNEEMMKQLPQIIRIKCVSIDDAKQKYEQMKQLITFKNYTARVHIHYHDENKPCQILIIDKK